MIIEKIYYDFSPMVNSESVKDWTTTLQTDYVGRVLPFIREQAEDKSVLLTDKVSACVLAKERGIPYVLFLHDGNREADFKYIPYAVEGFEGVDAGFLDEIYRRFMGIPWEILQTDRLLIREMTEDDLDALYEVYQEPSVSQYTENLYEDPDEERAYIRDYIRHVYTFCGYGIWVLIEKSTGMLIGRAGLACRDGFDTPELGYVIGVPYQKKGYATEACKAILRYADERLGFQEIRVLSQPDNEASVRLCEKLGFVLRGEVTLEGKKMLQYIYKGNNVQ